MNYFDHKKRLDSLAAKPTWFGTLAWPAIGPDVNTTSTITNSYMIPAQARYYGLSYPYIVGPTNLHIMTIGRFGNLVY